LIKLGTWPGKYLLVHSYDEKEWFGGEWFAIVVPKLAMSLVLVQPPSLIIMSVNTKKVVDMAVVRFAFENSKDNEGEAIKLGFYGAQTFKVA
jgi:hypothetical protein